MELVPTPDPLRILGLPFLNTFAQSTRAPTRKHVHNRGALETDAQTEREPSPTAPSLNDGDDGELEKTTKVRSRCVLTVR
jgi:hypothetical protein